MIQKEWVRAKKFYVFIAKNRVVCYNNRKVVLFKKTDRLYLHERSKTIASKRNKVFADIRRLCDPIAAYGGNTDS